MLQVEPEYTQFSKLYLTFYLYLLMVLKASLTLSECIKACLDTLFALNKNHIYGF